MTAGLQVQDVRLTATCASEAEGFTHTFTPGAITVVLGPNLSGKTDLCRLIAGLPTRASGQVSWQGDDLSDAARQRQAAFVYQAFVNYPNLSVFDNIASPLRARRVAREEITQRVESLETGLVKVNQEAEPLVQAVERVLVCRQHEHVVGQALP